jgi:hypothetical protein
MGTYDARNRPGAHEHRAAQPDERSAPHFTYCRTAYAPFRHASRRHHRHRCRRPSVSAASSAGKASRRAAAARGAIPTSTRRRSAAGRAPVTGVTIDDAADRGGDLWDLIRADRNASRTALIRRAGSVARREGRVGERTQTSSSATAAASTSANGCHFDFFVERGKRCAVRHSISIVGMVSSRISISLRLRHQPCCRAAARVRRTRSAMPRR